MTTARQAGLVSCHFCHSLNKPPETLSDDQELHCVVCGSVIHSRIPDSLNRTWAMVIAAIILYIPANLLPIMTVVYWGDGTPENIMSGVISLMNGGMWPLALLIFVASIFIPIAKLLTLLGLLISVQLRIRWRARQRTQLYRITEFIGRWSMIDIFVIGILVALVQFGNAATVTPGLGALSFAAVVILTMNGDLFDLSHNGETWTETIAEDALILRQYAVAQAPEIIAAIETVTEQSPFRHIQTPGGYTMSAAITCCGDLGWVSGPQGYRYARQDPQTGRDWPEMPAVLREIGQQAAREAGYSEFHPDSCMINRYAPGSKMSLHQDRHEPLHRR